jgi:manganese/zinc/iron transport system permease protein
MSPQIEVQIIAVLVAAACALPGTFLVLRRMAMLSDAISHAILPGIVVAFFLTRSLTSPLLLVGAAVSGVLTVALVELLHRSRLVKEDAAIGITFPVLFSIGVILIARFAGQVHLDTDAVLLGELAFAPFDRLVLAGIDVGPKALWLMAVVLLANVAFIVLLYKELKIVTFDPALAGALGFSPVLLHYSLMALVSMTAVGAFDAVGSVLVVALMIAPPAAAYLLTDRLGVLLGLAVGIGSGAALAGYWAARVLDASIAGCMAVAAGVAFALAYLFAPGRGMVARVRQRASQRRRFSWIMLVIHLAQHEGLPEADEETRLDRLHVHLRWSRERVQSVVRNAEHEGLVTQERELVVLTARGRELAHETIAA